MGNLVKIAVSQFRAELGHRSGNLNRCLQYIEQAGKAGAQIICFPELCHTGYGLKKEEVTTAAEVLETADFLKPLSECALQNHIYVIYSYIEKDADNHFYISAVLIGNRGEVMGNYRKCYRWGSYEQSIFTSDTNFPVFETEFGKVGILICYDMEYPETARILWKQQADIIFVPMHFWTIDYMNKYAQAIAIYNTLPVVVVNGVADDKESRSKVFDEDGNVIAECKAREEDFIVCDVMVGGMSDQRRIHWEEYIKEIEM